MNDSKRNQIRPGHLARSGELKLKQTTESRDALSQRATARYVLDKFKPAALDWKQKSDMGGK